MCEGQLPHVLGRDMLQVGLPTAHMCAYMYAGAELVAPRRRQQRAIVQGTA
jgi:cytidylate kinase